MLSSVLPAHAQLLHLGGFQGDLAIDSDRFLALDLNGDKITDFIYYRPGGRYVEGYISHGDGTFRYVPYTLPGQNFNGFLGDAADPRDTAVALDFNGDGKQDFLWYRPGAGWAAIYISHGDGQLTAIELSRPGLQSNGFTRDVLDERDTAVPLDINGDGRTDFLWFRPGGGFADVFLSLPNGKVQQINYSGAGRKSNGFVDDVSTGKEKALALDLNGDGNSDFLWYAPGAGFARAYISLGGGRVRPVVYAQPGQRFDGFTGDLTEKTKFIKLDANGDHKDDLLWYQPGAGNAALYLSNGDGTLRGVGYSSNGQVANGFASSVYDANDTAVAVDLNGDGRDDFIWYSPADGYAGAYTSTGISGKVSWLPFLTAGEKLAGFDADLADARDTIAAANLTGRRGSGFILYRPGGGVFQGYSELHPSSADGISYSIDRFSYLGHTETWMSDSSYLIGKSPLKAITMPGTHDAAMYPIASNYDFSKTQRLDLYHQMQAGSRWLDMRLARFTASGPSKWGWFPNGNPVVGAAGHFDGRPLEGFFMSGHGNTAVEVSVADAFKQIRDFLNDHPKEIVILSLDAEVKGQKGDWSADFAQLLKDGFGTLIYSNPRPFQYSNSNLPQNLSPEDLVSRNTRVVLINGNDQDDGLDKTGLAWPNVVAQYSPHYGSWPNGTTSSSKQLSDMTSVIASARPAFQQGKDANWLLQLGANLTPNFPSLDGPIILALSFNPQLAEQMHSAEWKRSALNILAIDDIGADNEPAASIIEFNDQQWISQRTDVSDIAIGGDGSVWVTNRNGQIYYHTRDSNEWQAVSGIASRIAVDPKGIPWVVTASHEIYRYTNLSKWELMPGGAADIGIGADGTVWTTGPNDEISRWNGVSWDPVPGAGRRIAVDPAGRAWVVNAVGWIFHYNPAAQGGWDRIPGLASDIGVGGDGEVWVIGTPFGNGSEGGLWRLDGSTWSPFRISGVAVAVGTGGAPSVVRDGGALYSGVIQ